jgi:hypothetical protein
MDENRPLDIFLQPSKRLIILSLLFALSCFLLLYYIPLIYLHKLLLLVLMSSGILMELRLKVLLTSPSSIIRLGCDGGITDSNGDVSNICWWYQRRIGGDKIYVELSPNSRVWADWVALDFSRWPWQFGQTVLIARDSVEESEDFQRLKRLLRSR